MSSRRVSRALSKRIVSCGSQSSDAAASTLTLSEIAASAPLRAIDLFGSDGDRRSVRAGADGQVDGRAVAAGEPAGGVDEQRFGRSPASRCRKAHAQRTAFVDPRPLDPAAVGIDAEGNMSSARLAAKMAAVPQTRVYTRRHPSDRQGTLQDSVVQIIRCRWHRRPTRDPSPQACPPVRGRNRDTARPG